MGALTNRKNDGIAVAKFTYTEGKPSIVRLDKDSNIVTPKKQE